MEIKLYNGQDLAQDTSVKNYMDTFFLCHVGKDKLCENMVTEHTLVYLVSGEMDVVSLNISAQAENGFQEFDVLDNFKENPFTYFTHAPILAAGDKNKSNAMTIGWGHQSWIYGLVKAAQNKMKY